MEHESISIRKVEQTDMIDVIELLQSISQFKPFKSDFFDIWNNLCKQINVFSVVAIIDDKVVGYGSILIETNIRGGKRGHIEDVVSHLNHRKKSIGKSILDALFDIAKENECYKITLQCKENNFEFYKKCDYEISGIAMQRFLN